MCFKIVKINTGSHALQPPDSIFDRGNTHIEQLPGAWREGHREDLPEDTDALYRPYMYATVNMLDSMVIFRMDMGFYLGMILWPPLELLYKVYVLCQKYSVHTIHQICFGPVSGRFV